MSVHPDWTPEGVEQAMQKKVALERAIHLLRIATDDGNAPCGCEAAQSWGATEDFRCLRCQIVEFVSEQGGWE